jgi:dsDNA-specific endonuclease/ATPase MutS2
MTLASWLRQIFNRRQKAHGDSSTTSEVEKSDAAEPDEDDFDPFNPFPDAVAIEITDALDLHAFAPRDVRRIVEEYLSEAHARGFRRVRIIHGKGVGAQREIVRSVLARTPFVEHFSDAPPEAGGWGATVARLSE